MTAQNKPAAEIAVDKEMVRGLLASQMPDIADLDIVPGPSGFDNYLFRVGNELAVRLPRRQMSADLVVAEQRWLPILAPRLPLPIAAPLRCGVAQGEYPWGWSVVPWIDGEVAAGAELRTSTDAARSLGEFVAALHVPAPSDAPISLCRGGPLTSRIDAYDNRRSAAADLMDVAAVDHAWQRCLDAPKFDDEPVWLHGDLHPGNVIVRDGVVVGVIDFGDICSGDPATDLAIAFMMFNRADREAFRSGAGAVAEIDDDTWLRACGWALTLGVMHLVHSADGPMHEIIGRRAINAVIAELL